MESRLWKVGLAVAMIPALLIGLLACGRAEAPEPGTFPVGSWATYRAEFREGDSRLAGTMTLSVLDRTRIEDQAYTWFELVKELDGSTEVVKFLAADNPAYDLESDFEPWKSVREVVFQKDAERPKSVPSVQVKKYAPRFIESTKTRRFGNAEDVQPPRRSDLPARTVEVAGKSIEGQGRQVELNYASRVNLGFINMEDLTTASYKVWTARDLPFGGLLAVEHQSTTATVNKLKPEASPSEAQNYSISLVLERHGATGAQSRISGEPEPLQAPAFPFIKGIQQSGKGQAAPPAPADQAAPPASAEPAEPANQPDR